jgi:hypothetical protein
VIETNFLAEFSLNGSSIFLRPSLACCCVVASTAIKPSIQFGGAPAIPPMLPQSENWDGIMSPTPLGLIHDPAFLDFQPLRKLAGG